MSDADKMINIALNSRDAEGNVCDTDNMDISLQDAAAIIDKAADLALIFAKYQDKPAQDFYDAAFNSLDDLDQLLIGAGILAPD